MCFQNKEVQITSDIVVNMCEQPEDYAVYVSKEDLQKEKYISELNMLFEVDDNWNLSSNRIKDIIICMQVVKAVTDVYMENWNTGSLEEFVEALTSVKNEVESIRDDSVSGELELKFIGRNGETIKKLYSYADENTGSILRNVIEDTLDEYDDLSVNDRVSILLEMIEKIIK